MQQIFQRGHQHYNGCRSEKRETKRCSDGCYKRTHVLTSTPTSTPAPQHHVPQRELYLAQVTPVRGRTYTRRRAARIASGTTHPRRKTKSARPRANTQRELTCSDDASQRQQQNLIITQLSCMRTETTSSPTKHLQYERHSPTVRRRNCRYTDSANTNTRLTCTGQWTLVP